MEVILYCIGVAWGFLMKWANVSLLQKNKTKNIKKKQLQMTLKLKVCIKMRAVCIGLADCVVRLFFSSFIYLMGWLLTRLLVQFFSSPSMWCDQCMILTWFWEVQTFFDLHEKVCIFVWWGVSLANWPWQKPKHFFYLGTISVISFALYMLITLIEL